MGRDHRHARHHPNHKVAEGHPSRFPDGFPAYPDQPTVFVALQGWVARPAPTRVPRETAAGIQSVGRRVPHPAVPRHLRTLTSTLFRFPILSFRARQSSGRDQPCARTAEMAAPMERSDAVEEEDMVGGVAKEKSGCRAESGSWKLYNFFFWARRGFCGGGSFSTPPPSLYPSPGD